MSKIIKAKLKQLKKHQIASDNDTLKLTDSVQPVP